MTSIATTLFQEGISGLLAVLYVLFCSAKITSERVVRKARKRKAEDYPLYPVPKAERSMENHPLYPITEETETWTWGERMADLWRTTTARSTDLNEPSEAAQWGLPEGSGPKKWKGHGPHEISTIRNDP